MAEFLHEIVKKREVSAHLTSRLFVPQRAWIITDNQQSQLVRYTMGDGTQSGLYLSSMAIQDANNINLIAFREFAPHTMGACINGDTHMYLVMRCDYGPTIAQHIFQCQSCTYIREWSVRYESVPA